MKNVINLINNTASLWREQSQKEYRVALVLARFSRLGAGFIFYNYEWKT